MTAAEIKEAAKRYDIRQSDDFEGYEWVGIRVQEQPFELGGLNHRSSVWVDGDETGELLDGLCAIDYRHLHNAQSYYGDHMAIIAGNRATWGDDPGEIIIEDAVVVEIIK